MGSAIVPFRSSLPTPSAGRGLVAYLTSRRNLTGSALALVGAGLVLADPVGLQGILLVAVLYLAGALAVHGRARVNRFGFDPGRLQKRLSEQITAVAARVPPEILARLQRIELTTSTEILPHLDCLPLGAPEPYLIERTVSDYPPAAIDAYLRLPAGHERLSGRAERARKTAAIPEVGLGRGGRDGEQVNRDGRIGGPLVEEPDASLDLLDLAGDAGQLVLDRDAVRDALGAPHQVEEDRLLCLLILEPGLQVDILSADILAGDLELGRLAEPAQRRERIAVAG